jgi:predicted GIY-YIG superfamily endonuclease
MLCADQERSVREVREDTAVIGAIGWGEVGTEKVADVLVQYDHKGPVLTLTTSRGAVLRASPEHLCFGRLNPLCRQHYLYLMERSSLGFRVGLTSDLQRDLVAVQNLKLDLFHQHEVVDRLWIIEATDSLPRATFLEKLCTFKYGLPNIPFTGRHLESDLPEELVLELFNQIDTPSRAHQLLMDWYMFQDSPHITLRLAGAQAGGSNAVQFTNQGIQQANGIVTVEDRSLTEQFLFIEVQKRFGHLYKRAPGQFSTFPPAWLIHGSPHQAGRRQFGQQINHRHQTVGFKRIGIKRFTADHFCQISGQFEGIGVSIRRGGDDDQAALEVVWTGLVQGFIRIGEEGRIQGGGEGDEIAFFG